MEYTLILQVGFDLHVARSDDSITGLSPQVTILVWVAIDISDSGQHVLLYVFFNVSVTVVVPAAAHFSAAVRLFDGLLLLDDVVVCVSVAQKPHLVFADVSA